MKQLRDRTIKYEILFGVNGKKLFCKILDAIELLHFIEEGENFDCTVELEL